MVQVHYDRQRSWSLPPIRALGHAELAQLVDSPPIAPVVLRDPDDDHVLACAVAANAELIVAGDQHLLDLKEYQGR